MLRTEQRQTDTNLSWRRIGSKNSAKRADFIRFLLIEDNASLAAAILERLRPDGHVVDHAADIDTAETFAATGDYDMILLDIMLTDGDGRDFLRRHREARNETPVIVLTARSEVSDRVGVLDLGADDYIPKPFDFAELEARCRAVLRRRGGGSSNITDLGGLRFDPMNARIEIGGRVIALRNKELRLLEIFINAPDRIFAKSALVDRLFAYDEDVSENAIEVYVGRLRKHLAGSGVKIVTARGVGYRLSVE